jgi:hypothetical protein
VLVGGRPVFLVVYATLAPVAIIASAWLSPAESKPMVLTTKTILLGVGFCWVWARRRMTTVEWIGVGFDPVAERPTRALGLHVGLDSVVERVRLAGGEVTIESAPGRGSQVVVLLPAEPVHAQLTG